MNGREEEESSEDEGLLQMNQKLAGGVTSDVALRLLSAKINLNERHGRTAVRVSSSPTGVPALAL